ncbi:hypothetical protein O6H91_06G126700 [Diphasiastrum complanatum]|uniref:Uncharacterized protein n=1 Tax=Diphasiastrum complanatum TaxID=34168 RepID=A0ACC2DIL0_DIPCM|nr:hypothetical protein O6H91_06G126700 [Diphasiastrum complanatum]
MKKQRNNKEKRESASEKVGTTAMERRMLERSVYEACVSSPEGADLLVNIFVQALMSYRRSSVCKPFPNSLFSECCSNEKDFASAMEAVQHIPDIHKIALSKQPDQELEDWTLDRSSYHATALQEMPFMSLKLLQWLLFSREHMELTSDPAKELSRLLTMRFSPWTTRASKLGMGKALLPEFVLRVKEAKKDDQLDNFAEIRSRSGSFFAFHGTAAENLYSILRCGLLNMSRTQMQRNGAIFGEGIYFSMDPNVAVGFSTAGRGWNFSCFGERQKYVLLCDCKWRRGSLLRWQ